MDQKEDSKGGFEIAEIVPIRNVYIAVRRYIDSSRAVKVDASNGYSYIEDVTSITDTDGNEIKSDIYLRSNKYADLGGNTVNFNGVFTSYTMDNVSYEKQEKCIDALNLSGVQAKILKLRLEGYGYESIATYLGVKNGTVMKNMERIQKKAIDVYKLGDVMLSKKETSKKN